MTSDDIGKRIAYLKSALTLIEGEFEQGHTPPEGLDDLKIAVDGIRSNVWAVLSAAHTDNYDQFVGRFRIRRGTEICERIISDVERGTITARTPDVDRLDGALRALANALHVASRVK